MDGDDAAKAETRATMAWVLDQCLILLHPIMPFITEELWATLGQRAKMLVHTDWPTYTADIADPAADTEMLWAIALIEGIRSARAQMNVPAGLQVTVLKLSGDAAAEAALANNEALIKRLARIGELGQAEAAPRGSITVPVAGATFALPLADIIDVAAEKARLSKAMEKLAKEIGGLKGRLNNPNFVASAPEEVVDEARENLACARRKTASLPPPWRV